MGMTTFETVSATWTCDTFIDEDGSVWMRLGLTGDDGREASVTTSARELSRATQINSDLASRVDELVLIADRLVDEGTWTLHQRDAYLRERCAQLATRTSVNSRPASLG